MQASWDREVSFVNVGYADLQVDSEQMKTTRRNQLDGERREIASLSQMRRHVAHQIAPRYITKKMLREKLQDLGLLPRGLESDWSPKLRQFWKDAFSELLSLHPTSHGAYELKDEVWGRIEPDRYNYSDETTREKARKRKSEKLRGLNFGFLQGVSSEDPRPQLPSLFTPESSAAPERPSDQNPMAGEKRKSSGMVAVAPPRKRERLELSSRNVRADHTGTSETDSGQTAATHDATDSILKVTRPRLRKNVTKKCTICKQLTIRYKWRLVKGREVVACAICFPSLEFGEPKIAARAESESPVIDRRQPFTPDSVIKFRLSQQMADAEPAIKQELPQVSESPTSTSSADDNDEVSNTRAAGPESVARAYVTGQASDDFVGDIGRPVQKPQDALLGPAAAATEKNSSQVIEELQTVILGLKNDIVVLEDSIKNQAAPARLQKLQLVNERLQGEVEKLTEEKAASEARIIHLEEIEKKYNAAREFFSWVDSNGVIGDSGWLGKRLRDRYTAWISKTVGDIWWIFLHLGSNVHNILVAWDELRCFTLVYLVRAELARLLDFEAWCPLSLA